MGPRGEAYRRLAITLLIPAAMLVVARVPMPGVDLTSMRGAKGFDVALFGVFALGLNTFSLAFVLVELLAVVVPRWRGWRTGGYAGRARLWTGTKVVALMLVTIQAYYYAQFLQRMPAVLGVIQAPQRGSPVLLLQVVTMVAGSFLLAALARFIEGRGTANGFSILMVAPSVAPTVLAVISSARQRFEAGDRIGLPLVLTAVTVAATTRLAGGRPLRPQAAPVGPRELPAPSSSLLPVVLSQAVMAKLPSLATLGIDLGSLSVALAPGTRLHLAAQAVLIAVLCPLLAWLFNRPRAVVAARQRLGGDDAAIAGSFARSLAWSLAICWGLATAQWLCTDARLTVGVVVLTVIACVATDVGAELRFRLRHGALVGVRPVHQLYALPVMLDRLERAGIPTFPRGRHHRTLWSFAAPYVPVELLVPVEHAQRAADLVLFDSTRPRPSP